jgi:hypothetical protein
VIDVVSSVVCQVCGLLGSDMTMAKADSLATKHVKETGHGVGTYTTPKTTKPRQD